MSLNRDFYDFTDYDFADCLSNHKIIVSEIT